MGEVQEGIQKHESNIQVSEWVSSFLTAPIVVFVDFRWSLFTVKLLIRAGGVYYNTALKTACVWRIVDPTFLRDLAFIETIM